jgi:hypothetical protein
MAGAQGWQPHRHLWACCQENVGTTTSHKPMGIHGLLQGYITNQPLLISQGFRDRFNACYMPNSSHFPWLGHPNTIWGKVGPTNSETPHFHNFCSFLFSLWRMKFIWILFKNWIPTYKRTYYASITKTYRLTLYREMSIVYSENHRKDKIFYSRLVRTVTTVFLRAQTINTYFLLSQIIFPPCEISAITAETN